MPEIQKKTANILFMGNRAQNTGKVSGLRVAFHVREAEKREFIHRLYLVKEIVSPEIVVLDGDLRIKLLGVKEKKEINGHALQFLKEKLKGQKVFLKFDTTKYDSEGNLLCYLYLKNKTFINAHLIKNNLVDVDSSMNYKYKSNFLNYGIQYTG